jgi:peptidoglycan/LPS O-acetylase OafA/YrhL
LKPLTGLRFLAALIVVFSHRATWWWPGIVPTPREPGLARGLVLGIAGIMDKGGGAAVTLFFVLSGFILAYTYLHTGAELRGGSRAFYVARVARIYPVYVLGLAIAVAPYLLWHGDASAATCSGGDPAMVRNVAMVSLAQAWLPFSAACWNPPSWSLSAEAFFYLLFPLTVAAICHLTRRQLRNMMAALWVVELALQLAYLALHPPGLAGVYWLRVIYYNPLACLPTFLIGVALGRLFAIAHTQAPAGRERRAWTGKLASLSLCGSAALLAMTGWLHGPLSFGPLCDAVVMPILALLVYALAWGHGRLAAFFALPVMVALGEASYALYILHEPIWDWTTRFLPAPPRGAPTCLPFLLAYLCLLLALSLLTMRMIEQPARTAIRRIFAPGPQVSSSLSALSAQVSKPSS